MSDFWWGVLAGAIVVIVAGFAFYFDMVKRVRW